MHHTHVNTAALVVGLIIIVAGILCWIFFPTDYDDK